MWFIGPHSNEKLLIMNKLPIVYRRANFLALITRNGAYKPARVRQKNPMAIKPMNPTILCLLDSDGKQESFSASASHWLLLLASSRESADDEPQSFFKTSPPEYNFDSFLVSQPPR